MPVQNGCDPERMVDAGDARAFRVARAETETEPE